MKKIYIVMALLTAALLGTASGHVDHGGIVVGDYAVSIQPILVSAGEKSKVYILIDYAATQQEASGLEVHVAVIDPNGDVSGSYDASEIPPGVYYFEHLFDRPGTYQLKITFSDVEAILSIDAVKQTEEMPLQQWVLIAVGVAIIASASLLHAKRRKARETSNNY